MNQFKNIALMWACRYGNEEIVKDLLQESVDINFRDQYGYTLLMRGTISGSKNIVKDLILGCPTGCADVTLRNNEGRTALYYALKYAFTEIENRLLSAGAT